MTRREMIGFNRFFLLALSLPMFFVLLFASPTQAASAGWRLLGTSGPTNLPPFNSEVQKLGIDAAGGTYKLTFGAATTDPIPFDADSAQVAAELNDLSTIGGIGGSVEVSGGPGSPSAAFPYFVRFGGGLLAGTDVAEMTADASGLGGGAVNVTTRTQGGTAGQGYIVAIATNVSSSTISSTMTMHVGPLETGITTSGPALGNGWNCSGSAAGQSEVTCTSAIPVQSLKNPDPVVVPVQIGADAPSGTSVPMSISDTTGNTASYLLPVEISLDQALPGVQSAWAGAFDAQGEPATIAGGHPAAAAAAIRLNTRLTPRGQIRASGDLRNLDAALPPGFVANPTVTSRCPQSQPTNGGAEGNLCTNASTVGVAEAYVDIASAPFDTGFFSKATGALIFNDEPPVGYPAQFAFFAQGATIRLVGSLRSDEDFGVTGILPNVPQFINSFGGSTGLEGAPDVTKSVSLPDGKAFLTNSTDCEEQAKTGPIVSITANSWQMPNLFSAHSLEQEPVEECENLEGKFNPEFSFQPSTNEAASVTSATAHLHVPQEGLLDPNQLTAPHLKKSVVKLPEGMVLNPAAAEGLQACSTAQIGLKGMNFPLPNPIRFDKSTPACPEASKIGTVEAKTPLLEETLQGTVYLAAQGDNPFGSLLAIYLVIDDPKSGTIVKLPGLIDSKGEEGLTATFDYNPQLPVEDLTLRIRGGGPRSQLATPDVCGPYNTHGEWTPWSAPESGPPARTDDGFSISSGPGGRACANTKAQRPFNLGFSAGTTSPAAGKHSPFVLNLTRPDGNQEFNTVRVTTPPGFAATLKGVTICSDAQLAKALSRSNGGDGVKEMADPSCPAGSQVGTSTIAAGVGSSPLVVKTGHAYLTGPYRGAPASLTFIVPAVAGPFDLGVQVVRAALNVNPVNAEVTAVSDSIPQILQGIPLQIRRITVDLDRPGFALNPTNCETMSVSAQVTGGSGALANLSNRFQVDNCSALGFKPKLKIQLHGKTRRAAYQRLEATVTARAGDANIARAAVTLPHSSFLAQNHIRTVCTRVQFAADACPPGSVYGHAEAVTPLLDGKLTGPVYLRSSNNPLPDLVAALRGPDAQPIEVELAGRTDSKHGGIRNTFDVVPDAPVSKFTLKLFGGTKSLIVNSRDLCKSKKQKATVRLEAQNGKRRNFRTTVGNDCGKKGKQQKKSR